MKLRLKRTMLPVACAAAVLLTAGCCTAPGPHRAILLHPLPPAEDGYTLSKGGLAYASGSYRVLVRPVDWREMEECRVVSRQGNGEKMDASRHVFFAVRLENLSSSPLPFDPARAEAVTEKGVPLTAAGFGETSFISSGTAGSDLPIDLRTRPETASVPSGGTMEGLIAYQVPVRAVTAVTLVLNGFRAGPAEKALRFTFEAFPGSADEQP